MHGQLPGRSCRALAATLALVAPLFWALLLVLVSGGAVSAQPVAAPPVSSAPVSNASGPVSKTPSVPSRASVPARAPAPASADVVGPATAPLPTRTATPEQAAHPATHAPRPVRAEQGGRPAVEQEVSAPGVAAQPPLPPSQAAGVVAAAYRPPVVPGPLAEVRRERAPPAAPSGPRLSRGPPSPRSS